MFKLNYLHPKRKREALISEYRRWRHASFATARRIFLCVYTLMPHTAQDERDLHWAGRDCYPSNVTKKYDVTFRDALASFGVCLLVSVELRPFRDPPYFPALNGSFKAVVNLLNTHKGGELILLPVARMTNIALLALTMVVVVDE